MIMKKNDFTGHTFLKTHHPHAPAILAKSSQGADGKYIKECIFYANSNDHLNLLGISDILPRFGTFFYKGQESSLVLSKGGDNAKSVWKDLFKNFHLLMANECATKNCESFYIGPFAQECVIYPFPKNSAEKSKSCPFVFECTYCQKCKHEYLNEKTACIKENMLWGKKSNFDDRNLESEKAPCKCSLECNAQLEQIFRENLNNIVAVH